jgi:lipase (class 3)
MGQPLDNQTATFYGQFVQAAYAMFKTPNSTDPLRPEPSGIPPTYELGAWIRMSDFILGSTEPKFYGIVAHNIDDPDSRIVAIRGTEGLAEWFDDAVCQLVHFSQVPSAGLVAKGFDQIYSSMKVVKYTPPAKRNAITAAAPETYAGSFAEQLEQLAISREAERGVAPSLTEGRGRVRRPTIVTGHSLGSALATLFVLENDSKGKFDISTLCTFASPKVGNLDFVDRFNQLPITSWRLVNTKDVVPDLPLHLPLLFPYDHVDTEYSFNSSGSAKNNPACWHSMDTYLHWLDPTHQVLPECAP